MTKENPWKIEYKNCPWRTSNKENIIGGNGYHEITYKNNLYGFIEGKLEDEIVEFIVYMANYIEESSFLRGFEEGKKEALQQSQQMNSCIHQEKTYCSKCD